MKTRIRFAIVAGAALGAASLSACEHTPGGGAPAATATAAAKTAPDISEADLLAMKDAPPLLLDVRTPGEFAAGHVPGAWNVPVDDVGSRVDEIRTKAGGREIVVYCQSGTRAGRAKKTLEAAGVSDVRHLTGDWAAWSTSGNPIEK